MTRPFDYFVVLAGMRTGSNLLEEQLAAMPGVVIGVRVRPGDALEAGAPLLVLEAMKMQNEVACEHGGVVEEVFVADREGNLVNLAFFSEGNTLFTAALEECLDQTIWLGNSWLLPERGKGIELVLSRRPLAVDPWGRTANAAGADYEDHEDHEGH